MKNFKKLLALPLALCILLTSFAVVPLTASAATYSGSCGDNLTWKVNTATRVLYISGNGAMTDYDGGAQVDPPWYQYREYIKTVILENGATTIGNSAFYCCDSITSITIPASVTSIGNDSFAYCYGLKSISLPNRLVSIGNYAFYQCDNLTSLTIPGSVAAIGTEAFFSCTSLQTLTIENGVSVIGKEAFYNCWNLASLSLPDSVTSVGDSAFCYCSALNSISLGNGLQNMGHDVFYGTTYYKNNDNWKDGVFAIGTNLIEVQTDAESYTIPDNITFVANRAFENCYYLTEILVSDQNTSFASENGVLYNKDKTVLMQFPDTGAEKFTVPDTVVTIRPNAFLPNFHLTKLCLGRATENLTSALFLDCTALTEFSVPAENTAFSAADGVLYDKSQSVLIRFPTALEKDSYTIPGSVTAVGDFAFYGCIGLWDVILPDSVLSVGKQAFANNMALSSIHIGSGVQSIGYEAFDNCFSLYCVSTDDLAAWCNIAFNDALANPLYYGHDLYLNEELVYDLVIPDTVTNLKAYTFVGCSISSLVLPAALKTVRTRAFDNCPYLETVTVSGSGKAFYSNSFDECYALTRVNADSLDTWCNCAFQNLRANPLYVARDLYIGDTPVCDIVLPENLTTVSDYAFAGGNITHVTIPESVTKIGVQAFYDCAYLETVTVFGDSKIFYNDAFEDCTALTGVYIRDLKEWCTYLFSKVTSNPLYYAHDLYLDGELVNKLILPENIPSLNYYAFAGCSITSAVLPEAMTQISDGAFRECKNLVHIVLPNSLTTLESSAFRDCTALTGIVLPEGITGMSASLFSGCENLTAIAFGKNLHTISESALSGCRQLKDFYSSGDSDTSISVEDDNDPVFSTNLHEFVCAATFYGDCDGVLLIASGEDAPLPVCDLRGFHYTFTANGAPWDGTNLTSHINVSVQTVSDFVRVETVGGGRKISVDGDNVPGENPILMLAEYDSDNAMTDCQIAKIIPGETAVLNIETYDAEKTYKAFVWGFNNLFPLSEKAIIIK